MTYQMTEQMIYEWTMSSEYLCCRKTCKSTELLYRRFFTKRFLFCLRKENLNDRTDDRTDDIYTRNNKEVYKKEKEEKEEASSDEEELDEPCINYKDIKQWEADNGKQWEGWIDWSD